MKKLFAIFAALIMLSACGTNGAAPASAVPTSPPPTTTAPPANTTLPATAPSSVAPTTQPQNTENAYAEVLNSWRLAVSEEFGYNPATGDLKQYPYIINPIPSDFRLARYAFYDVDGNGVTELLIASFFDFGYYFIADIFTIHDGEPVRLFEGTQDHGFWARNRLNFSKDGTALIVESSSGAAYSVYEFYRVTPDGLGVELIEELATYNLDNFETLSPHYRAAGGSCEAISDSDFDAVLAKYYDDATDDKPYFHSSFYLQIEWLPLAAQQ